MSELGRQLAEARTAKDRSLADVEAETRIRQKYLEALENGAYDVLPRGAVTRGFLRSYARHLGLDVDAILSLYTQESGDTEDEVPIAEPGKPRLVDYRPLEVNLAEPRSSSGAWVRWLAAFLIVALLAAVSWWFLNRGPGWAPLAAFGPRPTSTVTQTATVWVVTATPRKEMATPELPTPTSDLLLLPTPTVPPTITPTPRPTDTPETVASIAMDIRIVQRAWIRVVVDGNIEQDGVLEAGETRQWQAQQSISVRTGNAGGVNLTLNSEDLGLMGKIGQVVERSWVVDQGQVTEATPAGTETSTLTPTPTETPAG